MKGKFIKKLTAYALTAAMILSTPMTAFASEFADNFWFSDGSNPDDEKGKSTETGTGTVTVTQTTDLSQYDIGRIEIDPVSVVLDLTQKKSETLKVKVYDTQGSEITGDAAKAIYSQIEWTTSNYLIARPKVYNANGRENCIVTGYKSGFATITAGINVNPNRTGETDTQNKEYSYTAKCRIMVRKPATEVNLKLPNDGTLYAGHTYDLNKYISFGEDEFDEVTFEVTLQGDPKKSAKLIQCTKDGFIKVDKKLKDKDELSATVMATATSGAKLKEAATIKFSEGVPVTGLAFTAASKDKTNIAYDIAKKKFNTDGTSKKTECNPAEVTIKTTKDNKPTTDNITWESSDSTIVRVLPVSGEPFNEKTEDLLATEQAKMSRKVQFEGLKVGKATVIATSTSGKSAKLNVTVSATLIKIESAEVDNDTTYSGKATSLVIKRVPAQNQDMLKIVPANKTTKLKGIKVKAAITPMLTPGTDLSKVSVGNATVADDKITVEEGILTVEPSKKNKNAPVEPCRVTRFTIEQSDLKLDKVMTAENGGNELTAKTTVKVNPVRTLSYFAILDSSYINKPGVEAVSWESSKETVATIVGDGRIKVVGEGKAKITVSAAWKNGKSYKTIKKTFNIQSTPKCEKIVLKSDLVTVKAGKAAVINVKEQLPKKAADDITWWYYGEDGVWQHVDASKATTNKKCTLPNDLSAGSYTVVAISGSVEATAKVIVQPK